MVACSQLSSMNFTLVEKVGNSLACIAGIQTKVGRRGRGRGAGEGGKKVPSPLPPTLRPTFVGMPARLGIPGNSY